MSSSARSAARSSSATESPSRSRRSRLSRRGPRLPSRRSRTPREDGKLKFSGGVTFWLVLCAIFLGYTLLGFACTLFIYRFQAAYFQTISQFQELAPLAELLQALLASVEAYPVYYLAVAALVALQFGCVIWFLASKRRLAFYILAAAAAVLTVMQLILGGGVGALVYILGPLAAWLMLRRSWSLLR